jgi:spore maturation protein B
VHVPSDQRVVDTVVPNDGDSDEGCGGLSGSGLNRASDTDIQRGIHAGWNSVMPDYAQRLVEAARMTDLVLPLVILGVLIFGVIRKVSVYDVFLEGAKKGLQSAVNVLPCLVGMLAFIALLVKSGALAAFAGWCAPALKRLGIPEGALPVLMIRPFSGSATLAMLDETFRRYGPDSIEGRTASVMMGSSETIFYTLPLYFAAAKVKRSRYAIPAALIAWLAGGIASAWALRIW